MTNDSYMAEHPISKHWQWSTMVSTLQWKTSNTCGWKLLAQVQPLLEYRGESRNKDVKPPDLAYTVASLWCFWWLGVTSKRSGLSFLAFSLGSRLNTRFSCRPSCHMPSELILTKGASHWNWNTTRAHSSWVEFRLLSSQPANHLTIKLLNDQNGKLHYGARMFTSGVLASMVSFIGKSNA